MRKPRVPGMFKKIRLCSLWGGAILSLLTAPTALAASEHFSAGAKEVRNAPCRYPVLTKISEIEKYFQNKVRLSEKSTFEVLGFKFVNDSSFYVKHFKDLIEPSENTAYDEQDPRIENARRKCHSVRCALTMIMGRSESLKALYLLDKYRLNVAPMKYYGAGYFKDRDLDIILETMALVPPHLLPLSDIKQLTHAGPKSTQEENVYADSSMQFYDFWDTESTDMKKYLLFHEIAHNWSDVVATDLDESQAWLNITGWEKIASFMMVDWKHPHRGDFGYKSWVSQYASINSWEDFAESVSAYRFNPEKLLQASPSRYQFIKSKIFGNIEFRNGKNCQLDSVAQEAAKLEQHALQVLDHKVNVYNDITTEIEKMPLRDSIAKTCGSELKNTILNKAGAVSQFNACFKEILTKNLAEAFNWMTLDRQADSTRIHFEKAKRDFISQWLENTFVTQKMKSIRWSATRDYNCSAFAKNYKSVFVLDLETPTLANQEAHAMKYELAPAIGYWICADSKNKSAKTASIDKTSFDFLKKWLYSRLNI
ncbi:hypothetical protein EZJ49_03815 [Bdellovibrio bacteriovorus]|uniref:hypothetical protein n=1 Tax=Bdellovibrio bacteriovorus TaxID=959 RepID=UPI0021D30E5B|nr:hypothetical protein [Bdellovibrio bacteriovorus]UXR65378.1 hypothetical protein EZJ49_03815 [Bdellovibrio bacteriovorus]